MRQLSRLVSLVVLEFDVSLQAQHFIQSRLYLLLSRQAIKCCVLIGQEPRPPPTALRQQPVTAHWALLCIQGTPQANSQQSRAIISHLTMTQQFLVDHNHLLEKPVYAHAIYSIVC